MIGYPADRLIAWLIDSNLHGRVRIAVSRTLGLCGLWSRPRYGCWSLILGAIPPAFNRLINPNRKIFFPMQCQQTDSQLNFQRREKRSVSERRSAWKGSWNWRYSGIVWTLLLSTYSITPPTTPWSTFVLRFVSLIGCIISLNSLCHCANRWMTGNSCRLRSELGLLIQSRDYNIL